MKKLRYIMNEHKITNKMMGEALGTTESNFQTKLSKLIKVETMKRVCRAINDLQSTKKYRWYELEGTAELKESE